VTTYSEIVIEPFGLVLFVIVSEALSPSQADKGLLQGSSPDPDTEADVLVGSTAPVCAEDVRGTEDVGDARLNGGTVFVGNGVEVGASVGGMAVAVGIAA